MRGKIQAAGDGNRKWGQEMEGRRWETGYDGRQEIGDQRQEKG
jgi:hypothetical protein